MRQFETLALALGMVVLTGAGAAAQERMACADLVRLALPAVVVTDASRADTPRPACIVHGEIDRRTGANGKPFFIGFELRLPDDWLGRFLFSGGGGMDGVVRPAVNGLDRGFAVVTTDAGHQADPTLRERDASFGVDQQARIDNGSRAIERVTDVAREFVRRYYGAAAKYSYLDGCSNGGRQGLIAAQRYPRLFDGIVSGAPAFRVPHAAIGSAWETIALTSIAPKDAEGHPILSRAFSDADLALIGQAVLKSCDAADGAADGLVFNVESCRRFDPSPLVCKGPKTDACLSTAQMTTLKKIMAGPTTSRGEAIYASWPYDPGIASAGWRMLKLGTSQSAVPNSADVSLMLSGLAGYFMTPFNPAFDAMAFDFDKDTPRIAQSVVEMEATATTLSTFSRKSKLLVYHGMADPFFSAWDTVDYMKSVEKDNGGAVAVGQWARLFLVPGMTHCAGGPALDQFDRLGAIVAWVETGTAPDRITATGRSFPGVSRPLCPYPTHAQYDGKGPLSDAASFTCK
jgi:hypothetical protein